MRGLIWFQVSFVGFISNIHSVCNTYHWLHWVCKLPGIVINLAQGFLPNVLLVLLFMLVPIVMRILARLEGIPQKTGVELSLMDRFFLFQVIVRASCAVLDQIAHKSTSGRLSDPRIFVWYCRVFT
jgi:calcium permeable stress-gated cation channel